jgi:hypothetical protein
VGSGVSGRDCCDRGDLPAAPAARALGIFAISAGFAVATIKATLIAHPILRFPAYSAGARVVVQKVPVNAGLLAA